MSWHDCYVHGLRLADTNEERGTAELELDIDFIVEWLCEQADRFRFRVAPATLTFHDVFGLRIVLDYATPTAGMTPFSIEGIEREAISYAAWHQSYRWRLPVSWPAGEITFESPGFTQVLRSEPVMNDAQILTPGQREARPRAMP